MTNKKYKDLAIVLLQEAEDNNIHWRKGVPELLQGEALGLLSSTDVYSSRENAQIVASILKIVAEKPNNFYVVSDEDDQKNSTNIVSKLVYQRFKNLSDMNVSIDSEMKRWLRSKDDLVLFKFIPSLINFYTKQTEQKIALDELLEFVFSWKFKKKYLVSNIGRDLYFLTKKDSREND